MWNVLYLLYVQSVLCFGGLVCFGILHVCMVGMCGTFNMFVLLVFVVGLALCV